MLSTGVNLFPNLVTRVEESLKTTLGNLNLTFPAKPATWWIFAHDCLWALLSRRSLLEHEQEENRLFCAVKKVQCLTDGEWNCHLPLEEPIGSMLSATEHVFSDSVVCTDPGASDWDSAPTTWEPKTEAVMKSDNCKNRKRHCRSVDCHWMARVQATRDHGGDSGDCWESQKVQNKCPAQASEVATYPANFWSGHLCFCGLVSETLGNTQDDKWIYHQQTPGFQVFEHSSTWCVDEAEERRSWKAFRTIVSQCSHAPDSDFWRAINSVYFRSTFHFRIESGRSHSVSSPQTTSLCSGWTFAPLLRVGSCSGWPWAMLQTAGLCRGSPTCVFLSQRQNRTRCESFSTKKNRILQNSRC